MTSALQPNVQHACDAQGWRARLELVFEPRPAKTVLARRIQRGPLAVQRPFYPEGPVCHVYILHPPGGVVGGDQLQIVTQVMPGAHAVLTSPGAMKFYRSQGQTALQQQQLQVGDNAILEWLPQETIYFPGAKATMRTRIDLADTARFIGWEIHCLGLPANQEIFSAGELQIELEIFRAGKPLILEKMSIQAETLSRPTGLRGQAVMATLVATPADTQLLENVRTVLADNEPFSATLFESCLVVRYLGDSTAECRNLFTEVWKSLRPGMIDRPACPPRIWST